MINDMSDDSRPPSQLAALPKKDEKKPNTGSVRGAKRPSPNSQAASAGNVAPTSSTGVAANVKSNRSNSAGTKKPAASPSNPAARLAAGENISRPSSADSHAKSGSKDNKFRHAPRNSQGMSGKKSQAPVPNRGNNGGAAPKSDITPDGSSGLSALQRVITDLKSIAGPTAQQGGGSGNSPPVSSTNASGIPLSGPAFQIGTGLNVSEPSSRHRKSASTGTGSQAYNPVHFAAPAYSNQLGVMQEDVEDSYSHDSVDDVVYHDQPGFTQPAPPPSLQRDRPPPNQPMGSFTAPRFQALAQQQQESGEALGPSGRPQLAPNFMFGGNRRRPSEDDNGFQFPPQHPDMVPQPFGSSQPPRRQQSEATTGVTPLMAEQVSLVMYRARRC